MEPELFIGLQTLSAIKGDSCKTVTAFIFSEVHHVNVIKDDSVQKKSASQLSSQWTLGELVLKVL